MAPWLSGASPILSARDGSCLNSDLVLGDASFAIDFSGDGLPVTADDEAVTNGISSKCRSLLAGTQSRCVTSADIVPRSGGIADLLTDLSANCKYCEDPIELQGSCRRRDGRSSMGPPR